MPVISSKHTALRAARTTKPGGEFFRIKDGERGLYLRVMPSGKRTWVIRSEVGGKTRWAVIAPLNFDDPKNGLDYDGAKAAAVSMRSTTGEANPIDAKRLAAQADVESKRAADIARADRERELRDADKLRPTLDRIASRYLGEYVKHNMRARGGKRSKAEDQRIYDRHVAPLLGQKKIADLKTAEIAGMRDAVTAPTERRKAVSVVRALLSHAKSDGLIEHNVALGVKAPVSNERTRTITDDEIQALWSATEVEGVRPELLAALKVQLLTGARAGEVLAMEWADINETGRYWVIPGAVAKNARECLVPLSPQAWTLIAAQSRDNDLVFPAHRAKHCISSSSFAQVMARIRLQLGLAHFTSHDLRRTAATRMAEDLKVLPHILEAILNHAGGEVSGVAAVYNRANYQQEKTTALEAWGREVERIAANRPNAGNVKPLIRAARA
jgi:integrase